MNDDIKIIQLDDYKTKNVGVLCLPGLESFLPDILLALQENYAVKTYYGMDVEAIEKLVTWSDILWIEWANEMAIEVTNKFPILSQKKVIVRLHSYEALSGYVPKIKWDVCDCLIFVAEHIKKLAVSQSQQLQQGLVDMHVVKNGVRVQ